MPFSDNKHIITDRDRWISLIFFLVVSSGIIGKGFMDVLTNPQTVTYQERQAIWEAGYQQKPYPRYEDRSAAAMGAIEILLGSAAFITGTQLFMPTRPKLDYVAKYSIASPQPKDVANRAKLAAQHKAIIQTLKQYLTDLYIACPFIEQVEKTPLICHWGEGGSGKSRTAMCIALLQLLHRWKVGSEILIFDSQAYVDPDGTVRGKNVNDGTWIAGSVIPGEQINSMQNEVLGNDRDRNSPTRIIIADEAGELSKEWYLDTFINIMKSGKVTARTRETTIHITGHTPAQPEMGGDKASAIRKATLRAATHFYYPVRENAKGERIKADVVFVRKGLGENPLLPQRIGKSDAFDYAEGWERFPIPDSLDPSVLAKTLTDHIIALGIKPEQYKAKQKAVELHEDLAESIDKIVENTEMLTAVSSMEVLPPEDPELTKLIDDFYMIAHTEHDSFENLDLADNLYNFLGADFNRIRAKPVYEIDAVKIYSVDSLRRSKQFKEYLEEGITTASFKELLLSLDRLGIGKLSKSKLYWIPPVLTSEVTKENA